MSEPCTPAGPASEPLPADDAQRLADVLKALADPVRLTLFHRIATAGDEVCVCDLGEVGVAQPTVSHHLRRLREAGLVDAQRRGTWVYYQATPAGTRALQAVVALS